MKRKPVFAIAVAFGAASACGHHSLHAAYAAGAMQMWSVEWVAGGQLGSQGIRRNTMVPGDGFEWGNKPGEDIQEWWRK
jgi:hypothetical protein